MKITDYEIVAAENTSDLEGQVVEQILRGWQPLGGIAATEWLYYQPMVKYGD